MLGVNDSRLACARSLFVCALLLLCACSGLSVSAQTIVGRISGTVKDTSGAIIPNATITVTNVANNLTRTVETDAAGFYTVTNLPVGTYTVAAERQGFKKITQADVALAA